MITSYDPNDNIVDVSRQFNAIELPNSKLMNSIPMSSESAKDTTHKWFDDALMPFKSEIKTEYVAASGAMILDSTEGIRKNTILKSSGQVYRVTTVTDATTLVVVYLGGDADANLTVDTEVNFQGQANVEGQEFIDSDYTAKVARENYTQIFSDYDKITGTQKNVSTYVSGNTLSDSLLGKMKRIKMAMARAFVDNTYQLNPSDNTVGRIAGGVRYYVQTNGYSVTAAFSNANLNAFASELKNERGAVLTEWWMNPATRANFNTLDTSKVIIDRDDNSRGEYVKFFITDEGDTIELKDDVNIPVGVIDSFHAASQLSIVPLNNREMKVELLSKDGDSERYQIVGEYTLKMQNSSTSGEFTIS